MLGERFMRDRRLLLVSLLCIGSLLNGQTFSFDPGSTYITESDTSDYGQIESDYGLVNNLTDSEISIQLNGHNDIPNGWMSQVCIDNLLIVEAGIIC